jgi:chromosome partitioning protein
MSPAKSVQQVLTKTARRECRILLLSSPKGGVGKSTLSQNILSLAAKQGLKALAVDLDPQQTLSKWFVRREAKSETSRDLPMFDLLSAELGDWQRVLAATQDYELAVIDTLPSLDHLMPDIHGLCSKADLVLVPTGATQTDLDSTVPWLTRLGGMGFQIATVLNKANRRENFFQAVRWRSAICRMPTPFRSMGFVPPISRNRRPMPTSLRSGILCNVNSSLELPDERTQQNSPA